MDDNVVEIESWRQERLDDVYVCPECEEQEWLITANGKIKCAACRMKFSLPPSVVEMYVDMQCEDE